MRVVIGNRLRDSNHPFGVIGIEALQRACLDLKVGLKLWLYLAKSQDGYEFGLSQKACENWGIKKDSYYRGKEELIEKRYLVPLEDGRYRFDEIPVYNYSDF